MKRPLPTLHARAVHLLWICLAPILLTLIGVAVAAHRLHDDPVAASLLFALLHTVARSILLAIGGALLLDLKIRREE